MFHCPLHDHLVCKNVSNISFLIHVVLLYSIAFRSPPVPAHHVLATHAHMHKHTHTLHADRSI
jgi:hypothetical protein